MALIKTQIEAILNLFVSSFVNGCNEKERKALVIQFGDAFGKSISDWKNMCREKIAERTSDNSVTECFDRITNCVEETINTDEYEVRLLEENDLSQVREIINAIFAMALTFYDDDKFKKFISSGYSVVACNGEEIVGVALAYEMPDYNIDTIYLDTFAVSEHLRGYGIGKKMLKYIQKLGTPDQIKKMKLQTDRKIDAYHIYKHWGFQDDELVHMYTYFL